MCYLSIYLFWHGPVFIERAFLGSADGSILVRFEKVNQEHAAIISPLCDEWLNDDVIKDEHDENDETNGVLHLVKDMIMLEQNNRSGSFIFKWYILLNEGNSN